MGILCIGVDGGLVLLARCQEVQLQFGFVAVVAGCAAHIPVVGAFGAAGDGDVFARFGFEVAAFVPVDGHILNELEGVHEALVVFRYVGCHLQGAVHGDVQGQLTSQRGAHMRGVRGVQLAAIHFEDARRIVHRATDEAREGQDGGVVHLVASEGFIFCAAGRFVADQVGVGAAQSCRAHGFVGIDHDFIVGGLGHGVQVVVHHPLAVVVLAAGDDVAHVAALDGVIAVVYHELVGLVHVAFVVVDGAGSLVVHHHLDALALGIAVNLFHVEVGVGGHEVKDVVLALAEPVFPALVPSFDQHGIKSMLGCKVDVAFHVLRVGRVLAVGFGLGVIGLPQFHAVDIVSVGPSTLVGNHVPPDADVFHGLNPGRVCQLAGFVQVEGDARSQDIPCVVAHDDGAPRRMAGRLHVALVSVGVGREPGLEHQVLVVQIQAHARVVHQGRFMQVDVKPVVRLHQQGRLYAGGREYGL